MRSKYVSKKPGNRSKRRESRRQSMKRNSSSHNKQLNYDDSETCSIATEEDSALNESSSCSVFPSFANEPVPKIVSSPSDLKYAFGELTLALKESFTGALTSVDATLDNALDKREPNSMVKSILVIGEQVDDLFCQASSPTTKNLDGDKHRDGSLRKQGQERNKGRRPRGRSREPRTKGPILHTTALTADDNAQEDQIYVECQRRLV